MVLVTDPMATSIVVRTRPDGDRASTFHGKGGRLDGTIVGPGTPGAYLATALPFTNSVTASVVPFEMPSCGRSVASDGRHADTTTIAASTHHERPLLIGQRLGVSLGRAG
jgi:hypothetical protein